MKSNKGILNANKQTNLIAGAEAVLPSVPPTSTRIYGNEKSPSDKRIKDFMPANISAKFYPNLLSITPKTKSMKRFLATLFLTICCLYSFAQLPNVMILAADDQNWANDVKTKLQATGLLGTIDLVDARSVTPTVSQMQAYKAIITWSNNGYANSATLGNNLATYVDGGGGLVEAVFAVASVPLSGNIATSTYQVMVPLSQTQFTPLTLGSVLLPSHPLMAGVSSFSGGSGSYKSTSTTLTSGSYRIANWSNGDPLIMAKDNVGASAARRVDLNFFPPSTTVFSAGWDASTNGGRIMANALLYVASSAGALNFDGSNDYVSIPRTSSLDLTGLNFTIEYWAKPTLVDGNFRWVISKDATNSNLDYLSGISSNNKWRFIYKNFAFDLNGTTTPVAGTWYHVACTYNGTTASLYVNGVLEASTAVSVGAVTNTSNIILGARTVAAPSQFFQGDIDEVRIWNRGLCLGEIANNRNCELGSSQTGLIAYYKFNQGAINSNNASINTLADAAGSNTGSLINFGLTGTASNWVAGNVSGSCNSFVPLSVSAGSNSPVLVGSNLNLTATPSGTNAATATYAWTGVNSFSTTTQNPTISSVTNAAAGTYNVTATALGCTATASTSVVVNTPGAALDLQGGADYVDLGTPLAGNSSFTKEGWIYSTNAGSLNNLFSTNQDPIYIPGGALNVGQGNNYSVLVDPNPFPLNVWTHVAVTYDRPANTLKLYVNGILKASTTSAPANTGGTMYLGQHPLGGGQSSVKMDEVRLWSRALCQSEIVNNMNCELNPAGQTGLVRLFHFNQGNASAANPGVTSLVDATGGGNGTLVSFALSGATSNWISPGGVTTGTSCSVYTASEIDIKGNSVSIADGDNTPTAGDHTNFGNVNIAASLVRTFTIENTGTANLTVSTIVLSGTNAAEYAVGGITLPVVIAANGSTTFTVTLTPTSSGNKAATVTINNSDCDEAVYDYAIQGNGVCVPPTGYNMSGGGGYCLGGVGVPVGLTNSEIGVNYQLMNNNVATGSPVAGTGSAISFGNQTIAGTYTVVATRTVPSCFSTSGSVTVTVNNPPTAYNVTGGGAYCAGGSGSLVGLSGSQTGVNYQLKNGVTNVGSPVAGTGSSLSFGSQTAVGTYTVVATNATTNCGANMSGNAAVTVNPLPTVSAVSNQVVCADAATSAVTFAGSAGAVFNWVNNTPSIGLAASGTGNIASFNAANNTNAAVTASITVTPVSGGGSLAYIVNNGSANVSVINTATNTVVATIPVGSNPEGVAISADGSRVYVANNGSGTVSAINTATNTVVATITVGANPSHLVVSPDGSRVYVSNQGANNVSVINTTSNSVIATVGVGSNPTGVEITPDGSKVYVSNYFGNSISVINTATNTVTATIPLSQPSSLPVGIIATPDGSKIYVASQNVDYVYAINTSTNTIAAAINIGRKSAGISIKPDGSMVYASDVYTGMLSVISTSTNTLVASVNVGSDPFGVSVTPDGNYVYVSKFSANNVSVVSTATNSVATTVNVGSHPKGSGKFISPASLSCSGTPATFTITVNPLPTATISGTTTICSNNSTVISFSGTPGATVNYNVNGGSNQAIVLDGSGAATLSVSPMVNSTYAIANVISAESCTTSISGQSATVTVNNSPAFVTCPSNLSETVASGLCGAIVNYTSIAIATPAANYTYAFSGATTGSGSGTGSGLTFNIGTTNVTVTATNSCGSATCSFDVTVLAPEMNIVGNSNSITDGDNSPSLTDNTDFGGVNPGVPVVKTYTIQNTGTANLNVSAINLTGANTSSFSVSGITLPVVIAAGGSTTFDVTFNELSLGIKNATVNVGNDDCNEGTYDYAITGEVTCAPALFTACPSNITTTAAAGLCSAIANYTATASGTPAATLSYTFTGATTGSGPGTGTASTFNVGVTTVTITANNPCSSVTCSFTVTVTDNQNPTIANCPANISKNVTAGQCGTNVSWVLAPLPPTVDQSLTALNIGTVGTDQWQSFTAGMNGLLTQIDLYHNGIQATNFTLTVYSGTGTGGSVLYTGAYNYGTVGSIWLSAAIPNGSQPTMVAGNTYTFRIQGNGLGFNSTYSSYGTYFSNSYGLNPCWSGGCWKIDFKTYVAVPGASPTANDNCGIASFTSTHNPGSFFPVGTTPVSYTATDIHGNTSTCSFNVTVTDNENPVIVAPANIAVNNDANLCGAVVNYTAPVGTDNCPGATTSQTAGLASGAVFPVGTTTNTFVVTDAHGNTANASFTVTVTDNQNPTIVAPANIAVSNNPGICGAVVTYTAPVGTDNCPGATTAQTAGLASGATFPVGVTTNTFVVTDAYGNTGTASFTVTVTDNQLPVLAGVPANANASCDNIPAPAIVTASDNCASSLPVTYNQSITTGAQPTSGLKGFWTFNEGAGSTTADQSGFATTGTLSSGTNWVTGQMTSAVQFPGTSNQYVNMPNATGGSLDTRYSLSMFAWYWPGTNGSQQNPIIQYNPSGWGCHLWQTGTNQLFVRFTQRNTLGFTNNLAANTLIPNQWNCVGATYDYATGVAKLWCNGVNVQTLNIGQMELSTNYPVRVGSVDFDGRRTNSKVDNVAIYDRALTATEVSQLCAVSCPQNYTITRTWSATDGANNTTTASQTITVKDLTPPVLTVPANIVLNNAAGLCNAVANFQATATDNCSNNLTITYSQNSGTAFPVGTTTVNVTAKDECGNTSTGSFTVTVNDNEDPTIVAPANIAVNNNSGICGAVVNYSAPVGTDNCPGATTAQTAGLASGSVFPVGTTTNTFVVTDAHGHTATASFTVTVTDNENPTIVAPANIAVNNDAGICGAVVTYTAPVGMDNCPGATTAQTTGLASGSVFPVGTTTNTFVVTDAYGQTATASFTVTVTDNENPTIVAPANIAVNNDEGVCGAVVTYTAPVGLDNCPGATTAQTAGLASGSVFPVGTTTNTFVVTDAYGQTATSSFTVTVTDNENPTIVAPANIAVNNDAGICGAVVTYTAPVGLDNCPGATTAQTAGLASGSVFPVGTTTNTFVVTDAYSHTATTSFTVTVTDNENPTIVAPANIAVNNDAGICGAVVTYNTPVGLDNCPGATTVQTAGLASGSVFPVGTTTNTFVVTDAYGQTATASFTVTVTDNENPTIVAPANIAVNNDGGICGAVVTYNTPVGIDNCPGATTAQTAGLASGSVFPVGTTTNTFVVTDAYSHTATISFTVTVTDNELPVVITQNKTIYLNAAGVATISANSINNLSTDNCGISSVSVSPYSFNCANAGANTVVLTVTDIHGNVASGNAVVTVVDTIKPVANCKNYTLNLSSGTGTISASDINNGSTDNCGIVGMSLSKTSFTCANAGANTVTLTVTDAKGNSSSCNAIVTVQYQPTCAIAVTPSNSTFTGGVPTNIYLGYGPQSATVTCNATGGTGFTYSWYPATNLSCANCQSPVFTPTTAGNYTYTVTATNSNGCSTTCTVTFCVLDIRVTGTNGNNAKVYICHVPPGNSGNPQTLSISVNAVPSHIGQHSGDRLGSCNQSCGSAKGEPEQGTLSISSERFNVYPNPTTGIFTIEIPYTVKVDKIVIMDMAGKVIETRADITGNAKFDLSNVARGMYMIQVMYGNKAYRAKISVQ